MSSAPAADPLPATAASPRRSIGVERAAWTFYVIAALGSSIGQIWVGVETPSWPDAVPLWVRALLVAPFAIVIDLGGAVASAFADSRRRIGEAAYGWRVLSAASVALAVGINVVGHAGSPYLATVFGGLGVFAYAVWLLHTSARRRDALRATGKLSETPPSYGLRQWIREPEVTTRAKLLAITAGLDVHASLTEARNQLRTEQRRAALAAHIEAKIRARHKHDPILASIAATTTPIDEIAQELIDMIDAHGWAAVINAQIQPPAAPIPIPTAGPAPTSTHRPDQDGKDVRDEDDVVTDDEGQEDEEDDARDETDELTDIPTDLAAMMPTKPAAYLRWRAMWTDISERPDDTNKQLADDLDTSIRTVQRIRAVGAAGLLDSPQPPNARVLRLATTNGVPHPEFTS